MEPVAPEAVDRSKTILNLGQLLETIMTMMTKHSTPAAPLSEVRPNSGQPADWAVSHQSPFPWLNTIAFLPAASSLALVSRKRRTNDD